MVWIDLGPLDPGPHSEVTHPLGTLVTSGGATDLLNHVPQTATDATRVALSQGSDYSAAMALVGDVKEVSQDLVHGVGKGNERLEDVHAAKEPLLAEAQKALNEDQRIVTDQQKVLDMEQAAYSAERAKLESHRDFYDNVEREMKSDRSLTQEQRMERTRMLDHDRAELDRQFLEHDQKQAAHDSNQAVTDAMQKEVDGVQKNVDSWRVATKDPDKRDDALAEQFNHKVQAQAHSEAAKAHTGEARGHHQEAVQDRFDAGSNQKEKSSHESQEARELLRNEGPSKSSEVGGQGDGAARQQVQAPPQHEPPPPPPPQHPPSH